jgi:hypothetical protein
VAEGAPLLRVYRETYRGFESLPLRQMSDLRESPALAAPKPAPSRDFARGSGEMAERLKAHAWKACVPKGTVGSNPTLSAI